GAGRRADGERDDGSGLPAVTAVSTSRRQHPRCPMRPRAVLFDLFGTVVQFAPQVPTLEIAGTRWRSTMSWLREAVERELPHLIFDDMLATMLAVTEEIVRNRPPDYREVPSGERFRRVLLRLGVEVMRAPAVAERLSL